MAPNIWDVIDTARNDGGAGHICTGSMNLKREDLCADKFRDLVYWLCVRNATYFSQQLRCIVCENIRKKVCNEWKDIQPQ